MTNNKLHTKDDILRQLAALGAPRDSIVLMHASLRLIGPVEGGFQALLDTLVEYFTAKGGLLCIPTHTWHNLGKEITLDMTSPDNCLGSLSTLALEDGRGLRSESPTHSMVVFGDREKALDFIKDEPFVKTPTAPDSCYGKLYYRGGYVLLAGVDHSKNTYLHAVAEILNIPNRMATTPEVVCVRRASGELVKGSVALYYADFSEDVSWRFPKYDTAFRYHGCTKDGMIGNAPTMLCDAVKMKETIELIFQNSSGEDPLRLESPIPPKWYCRK